ncbi:hypothetical protein OHA72_49660 [Dactylosporangium sp. NBC_01737]|uniref:hypothetical protein n=1 Tax=Dactylosporangium sp. NBC_01737 TaxID=2975959 RepID=UPI002E13A1FE|nr:hypothetical protein OHA72_49660 [Dactylosporangium sp. NBC_01737]
MRLSRVWLVFGVIGVLAVAGAAVSATDVSLRCAVVAAGVLAWHAATGARAAAPRVRWSLTAGCVLVAVAALARQCAVVDRPADAGWFAYGAPGTAALVEMRDTVCRLLGWELTAAGVLLGAVVLFAGAVHGLPRAGRRSRVVAAVAAAVVVVAGILADRWLAIDEPFAAARGVWPGLLVAAAGLALLVLAGRRADHRWLVAAGAALVAVQAAVTLSDVTALWLTVDSLTDWICSDGDGTMRAVAVSTTAGKGGGPEVGQAMTVALTLGGPALIVSGSLRAATPADGAQDGPSPEPADG